MAVGINLILFWSLDSVDIGAFQGRPRSPPRPRRQRRL